MKNKDTLKKVLRYIRRYMPLIVLSTVLAALTVAGTLSIPIIIGNAIDLLVPMNGAGGHLKWTDIISCLAAAGIIAGVTALLQWIMNVINNRIAFAVVRDIRSDAFEHIENLPLSYLDTVSSGDIVSRVISDADQFADGLLLGFSQLFTGVVTIFGTLIFMLTLDPWITLAVIVLTPVSLVAAKIIAGSTYNMFRKRSEALGEQTAYIDEIIGNEKAVKAFCREDEAEEKFEEINERLEKYSLRATFYSSLTNPTTRFINALVYAAVGVFGAMSAINGGITVGALSCFLSYANQYTKPFNEISGVVTELQNALACAGRLFELIEREPQIPEPADAVTLTDVKGSIKAENVSFSYTPDRKLIEGLNLDIKPGQKIAIVGPTGCGKTTFINLLMRFYDVTGGTISADGHDIREVTRHSLRSSYGMVLQDTILISGTVRDNIRMGKPDATDEEIIAAAKAAHAHSFIKRLPDKYDTVIGEDGGSLSQGQKQLLCISRIMLCLPPMLILDEATSSIDTRTELKIQDAFTKLMKGRTSFIVAHRLSTIRDADLILVMNNGSIIEQGKHDDLLALGGFYANLYNSQFSE